MEKVDLKNTAKHWYMSLFLGIVLILMGFWVFSTPLASYLTLSILFAITFLLTGIIELFYAFANHGRADSWGWSLVNGIIDVIIGILLVSHPLGSMLVLSYFVGFGILFRAIMAIGWAMDLRRQKVPGWGYLLFISILGLFFAFVLLLNPVFAGLTIAYYTALAFVLIGISQVYLSFRLKHLSKLI